MNTNYELQFSALSDRAASSLTNLKIMNKYALGRGAPDEHVLRWQTIAETALNKTAKLLEFAAQRADDMDRLKPHSQELETELIKGLRAIEEHTPKMVSKTFNGLAALLKNRTTMVTETFNRLAAVLKNRTTLSLIGTAVVVTGLGTNLASSSGVEAKVPGENAGQQSAAVDAAPKPLDSKKQLANWNDRPVSTGVEV